MECMQHTPFIMAVATKLATKAASHNMFSIDGLMGVGLPCGVVVVAFWEMIKKIMRQRGMKVVKHQTDLDCLLAFGLPFQE
mmetsp:Transcript_18578/g.25773  ORF Transcript_18578/g.25773 Transcript_18578/m.25773 type:complete len:81 (+) Transcript_18578:897-1139(+)